MVKSIVEGVTNYFLHCPVLKHGVLRVDALGANEREYVIEQGIFEPVVKRYVTGATERIFQFTFGSREAYSLDRLQNIDNSTFYELLADWVEQQSALGILPEMPCGCRATGLSVLSSGYVYDAGMTSARYQIQMQLNYYKEAPVWPTSYRDTSSRTI